MRSAIWILSALVLAAPASAWAQGTAQTNTLGLTSADFTIEFRTWDSQKMKGVEMNKTTFETYFNRAHCECRTEIEVLVRLSDAGRRKIEGKTGDVRLRAGDNTCVCTGGNCPVEPKCKDLGPTQSLTGLVNQPLSFVFPVRDLFDDRTATGNICDRETNQNVWVWINSSISPGSDPDLTDVSKQVELDGRGPPSPTGLNAVGGNEALQVSWNSLAEQPDLQGYQVLCARNGNLAPFPGVFKPRFDSPLCPAGTSAGSDGGADAGVSDAGSTASDAGSTASDAGSTAALIRTGAAPDEVSVNQSPLTAAMRGPAPDNLAALDPTFTCSNLITSQTSTRLRRLQNGIPYVVGVVAIDKRGNASPLTEVVAQAPIQTIDFYSGYRREGGAAQGGCVLTAGAPSNTTPTTWLLLGFSLLALRLGLRRRGDRR